MFSLQGPLLGCSITFQDLEPEFEIKRNIIFFEAEKVAAMLSRMIPGGQIVFDNFQSPRFFGLINSGSIRSGWGSFESNIADFSRCLRVKILKT